jgi:hypothetical protein
MPSMNQLVGFPAADGHRTRLRLSNRSREQTGWRFLRFSPELDLVSLLGCEQVLLAPAPPLDFRCLRRTSGLSEPSPLLSLQH